MLSRELEQIDGAVNIRLYVEPRLFQRRPHARARCQMHDAIKGRFSECSFQRRVVPDVGVNQFVIWTLKVLANVVAFDRGRVEIVEIIDDGDPPIAFAEKPIDKMRADKSRAACDQDVSHVLGALYLVLLLKLRDVENRSKYPAQSTKITSSHKSTNASPNARRDR